MKKIFLFAAAMLSALTMRADVQVLYDWYNEIGSQTIVSSTAGKVAEGTVLIHLNTDEVDCMKFASSIVKPSSSAPDGDYYLSIQPASGGFLAGDVVHVWAVSSNSDPAKVSQIEIHNESGSVLYTSGNVVSGYHTASEPTEVVYQLTANTASLRIGKKGSTSAFATGIVVRRGESVTPDPQPELPEYEDGVWNISNWTNESGLHNQVRSNLGLYANKLDTISGFGVIENHDSGNFPDSFRGSKRFKLGGAGYSSTAGFSATPTQQFVYFDVTAASEITLWYRMGGSSSRTVYITDGTNVLNSNTAADSNTKFMLTASTTGAGRVFIFGSNGVNFYKLAATNVGTTQPFIPTGMSEAEVDAPKAVKHMINGQVVIEKGGKFYNLLGAEIEL